MRYRTSTMLTLGWCIWLCTSCASEQEGNNSGAAAESDIQGPAQPDMERVAGDDGPGSPDGGVSWPQASDTEPTPSGERGGSQVITPDDGCPDEYFLNVSDFSGPGDAYAMPTLDVTCDLEARTMTVVSNGMPHYAYVPMTPNALVEVNHAWTITLDPALADSPTEIPFLGDAGFALNGVVWYGPNEGPTPDNFGDPVANDIMDWCGGHTANAYHYHAMYESMLVDQDGDGQPACMDEDEDYAPGVQPSPLLGFAFDGFPIYGPHGCLDSDCKEVLEFQSSWENLAHKEGTQGCETSDACGNPASCSTGPMGQQFDPDMCFTCAETVINGERTRACVPLSLAWDNHDYIEKPGDQWLDRCNGRIGPDGTYRYHATATFPYILGCYSGTPTITGGGRGRGGAGQGAGQQGAGQGAEGRPQGPQSCVTAADCVGACPQGSAGCTCHSAPFGDICVPTCQSDNDCPVGAQGQLVCNVTGGFCVPSQAGGGPPQD